MHVTSVTGMRRKSVSVSCIAVATSPSTESVHLGWSVGLKEPVTAHEEQMIRREEVSQQLERRFGIDCAAIHPHHVFAACVCHDDGAGRERRYGGQCEKATSVDGHGESVKRFPAPRDAVSVPGNI